MAEYDKTKFFYAKNSKIPIYAYNGEDHEEIASRILEALGLKEIFEKKFKGRMPIRIFLVYCGYVLVDISQEESLASNYHTVVIYNKKSLNIDYLNWLRSTYKKRKEDSFMEVGEFPLKEELVTEFYEDDTIKRILNGNALEYR